MKKLSPVIRRLTRRCAGSWIATAMLAVSGAAGAAGHQAPLVVTVNYELQVPVTAGDLETVSQALDQSGKMIYHRINLECEEMLKQFAAACELTKLNVQHGRRSGRRNNESQTVTVRANAKFAVQLRKPEQ
ncbi:MAG: hypothetical protein ACRBC3_09830 [Burkholderiaceae bacterium]